MLICQEWTTNNKLNKSKKSKMKNMSTIKTTRKIFMMRILIMMMISIRKNWMGYYKIPKYTQIFIRRKIKRLMNTQNKKITLRIRGWSIRRKI